MEDPENSRLLLRVFYNYAIKVFKNVKSILYKRKTLTESNNLKK